MLLRLSDSDRDPNEAMPGHEGASSDDAALLGFAEALIRGTTQETAAAGAALAEALGEAALGDAAAVVAQFSAISRIADGSGIRLDKSSSAATVDLRRDLGIDRFDTTVEVEA